MNSETKIRAKPFGDGEGLLVMTRHGRSDKSASGGDAYRVERMSFKMNGEQIAEAYLRIRGDASPLTKIATDHASAGAVVGVEWEDSRGMAGHAETKVR